MIKKRHLLLGLLVATMLLPLWMWLAWLAQPKKKLVVAIIDKSTFTRKGQEHLSLTWVLNHEKFTKTSGKRYSPATDYFGFIPGEKKRFTLTGLERFNRADLLQLSKDCNMAYYSDTYGVYLNEWYTTKSSGDRSGLIYGGLSEQDVEFMGMMKGMKKMVIAEFNAIETPTSNEVRNKFNKLYGVTWTGWTGRFFSSLDTSVNKEIPHWIVTAYKQKHKGQWPFTKPGIVLVGNFDNIVVLQDEIDLNYPVPHIKVTPEGKKYRLKDDMKYPYWFSIIEPNEKVNKAIANFEININVKGAEQLNANGIPAVFPAVVMHYGSDYQFCYFTGDFADNEVDFSSSYFDGISTFSSLLYSDDDMLERVSFFWDFYQPLMTKILNKYYHENKTK